MSPPAPLNANPYQLVTLVAGYSTKVFGAKTRFQLNVTNLMDDEFKRYTGYSTYTVDGVSAFVGNGYRIQDPRRVSLTVNVQF